MGITDAIGKAIKVLQKANQIELISELIEVQEKVLSMQEKILEVREENDNLKKIIEQNNKIDEIAKTLIPHDKPYYTIKDDSFNRYFCVICWNKNNQLMQMKIGKYSDGTHLICANCTNSFVLHRD